MYHFPSMPKVKFAKLMNKYWFYKALEAVEMAANKMGFVLVPFSCMTWRRKKDYAEDRKVIINGRSFFMMRENELTKFEREKLELYIRTEVLGEDESNRWSRSS